MRIDVVGRDLPLTEAIKLHAHQKAEKLPKYFDGLQAVTITIRRADANHKPVYDVELVLDVEKHEDFVSHGKNEDLYAAIDEAIHKGQRQLADFKERLKGGR
jgi:putative sigma-54 modulation protein